MLDENVLYGIGDLLAGSPDESSLCARADSKMPQNAKISEFACFRILSNSPFWDLAGFLWSWASTCFYSILLDIVIVTFVLLDSFIA